MRKVRSSPSTSTGTGRNPSTHQYPTKLPTGPPQSGFPPLVVCLESQHVVPQLQSSLEQHATA